MTIHIGKHNIRFLYDDKNSYFLQEYQNPKKVKRIESIKYCFIFVILFVATNVEEIIY